MGPLDISIRMAQPPIDPAARSEAPDATGALFAIESASAVVRHIRIDLPEELDCEDIEDDDDATCAEDTVEITGPFEIDLVTGISTPPLEAIELPLGDWKRVDVRLDDGEGDVLDGNTLVASGIASLDSGDTPFELALKFNEDVRFEDPDGISFGGGDAVLLGLDAGSWFADVPLAECAEDEDLEFSGDTLMIEDGDGSCSDVENAIKEAMKRSGDLSRD